MDGEKHISNPIMKAAARHAGRLLARKAGIPIWATGGLIAHAGGGIEGVAYSNSREALAQTLARRVQVVEMDFMFTTDGTLVCEHGWKENHREPQSLAEFRAAPAQGRFTHLTAEEALRMLAEARRTWLVVDTQEADCEGVYRRIVDTAHNIGHGKFLDMIVPEIYREGEKEAIAAIYPFKHWLFSVYKLPMEGDDDYTNVARYCHDNGIGVFAMAMKRATPKHVALAHMQGIAVAAHTVNDAQALADLRSYGVDIAFTDFL